VTVAQGYRALPEGAAFVEELAALRRRALDTQQELDEEARDECVKAGLDVLGKGVVALSSSAAFLAVLRDLRPDAFIPTALSTAVAGLGVVAVAAGNLAFKVWKVNQHGMVYLLRAGKEL
jgi:hypothetical protein